MHLVFHSYYQKYNRNNLLFENAQADIGDNLLSPMISIANEANSRGVIVSTSDNYNANNSDAIVFVEYPNHNDVVFLQAIEAKKPLYLLAYESPIIHPDNYESSKHSIFKKVFTWSDVLIKLDPSKYVKINYTYDIPTVINKSPKKARKLLTLIAGNKRSLFNNELYSERINVIKFMEKYHPADFDFYGQDWDCFVFGNSLIERIINKLKINRKVLNKRYKSYLGPVERKNTVMKKYAFSVCYENVKDIPGYITEKIFDSFFAGCVPIYLGADNIENYVPAGCFINSRKFDSFEHVYDYIKHMSQEDYNQYLNNIELFLNSEQALNFSNKFFSKTVIDTIIPSN